jgi:hypothetical protein
VEKEEEEKEERRRRRGRRKSKRSKRRGEEGRGGGGGCKKQTYFHAPNTKRDDGRDRGNKNAAENGNGTPSAETAPDLAPTLFPPPPAAVVGGEVGAAVEAPVAPGATTEAVEVVFP